MTDQTKLCGNCRYLLRQNLNETFCRRYPPAVFPMMTPRGPVIASNFPPVQPNQGCGEWAAPEILQ